MTQSRIPTRGKREEEAIARYNEDIREMDGYIYTGVKASKSMLIFNRRAQKAITDLINLRGKTIIDIGCGDGTYSADLVTSMGAASVTGIEPSDAWKLAQQKHQSLAPAVHFEFGSAYELPCEDKTYDVSMMRGVLHHLEDPQAAIREMFRVSREVFLLEPNGYNILLKIIEKISPYHRKHQEKSYAPRLIRSWMDEAGGIFCGESYTNLVPMISPSWFAGLMDGITPIWEKLPVLSTLGCGLYCVLYRQE